MKNTDSIMKDMQLAKNDLYRLEQMQTILSGKIEQQEQAILALSRKRDNLMEELWEYQNKCFAINEYTPIVLFAKQFKDFTETEWSDIKNQQNQDICDTVIERMEQEIQKNFETLAVNKTQISSMNKKISTLKSDYKKAQKETA